MHPSSPRVAIIGMGGYAVRHHEALLQLEGSGEARLVCACDPASDSFAEMRTRLRLDARGVAVHSDYRAMLDQHVGELDVVIIPTPIPLHAAMHREVVTRGLVAYLEKPPTLDPVELEQMIACDATARVPTLVGFNFIAEPLRQTLKRRLLAGEFGALRSVQLLGLWARSSAYYGRNGWAGRLVGDDGRLILDSCLGNGLSHHVHNLLHWAGVDAQDSWATPVRVRASLLRAHEIEGPDTVFAETETDTGIPLRIALSHACRGPEIHCETLVCERAEISYVTQSDASIRWRDGRVERFTLGPYDAQIENLRALFACLRGERSRPPTTLADSIPFVHLHTLAYVSAQQIQNWDEASINRDPEGTPARYLKVVDIGALAERFLVHGEWPRGRPRAVGPEALGTLPAIVEDMVAASAPALRLASA